MYVAICDIMYGLCTLLVRVYFYSMGRNTEHLFSGWVWVTVRTDFYSMSRMAIYYVTIRVMSCVVGILNKCSVGGVITVYVYFSAMGGMAICDSI